MKKNISKLFIIISLSGLLSCAQGPESNIVATYSGGKVTKDDLSNQLNILKSQNKNLKNITIDSLSNEQKQILVKEIVLKKISSKQAKKFKLNNDEDYKNAIANFSANLLQKKLYIKLAQDATKDELVKDNYQKLKSSLSGKKDYKIAAIIVNTEKEAKGLRYRLRKNKKLFNYFATKKSIDEKLAKNKGVIDYSNETTISANIISKIEDFKSGQISSPIKLGQKWALIKFINKRDASIKSYELSKDQLSKSMATKAIKNFTDKALKDAKIQMTLN